MSWDSDMGRTEVDATAHEKTIRAAFKAQSVLEALKETKTITQIASEHQTHPNPVTKWKQEGVADSIPRPY